MKNQEQLENSGFTESGKARFIQTVEDYSEKLFSKASSYGNADKAKDLPLEVTHDHVRQAAHSLASSYGKERPSKWAVACHIGEYIFTAIAGIGGGNISKSWGQITFGVSLAIAVILIVFRISRTR